MRREELQAVQAPLKQHYRQDPAAGLVTLRAEGDADASAVSCSVQTGRALVEAGSGAAGPDPVRLCPPVWHINFSAIFIYRECGTN